MITRRSFFKVIGAGLVALVAGKLVLPENAEGTDAFFLDDIDPVVDGVLDWSKAVSDETNPDIIKALQQLADDARFRYQHMGEQTTKGVFSGLKDSISTGVYDSIVVDWKENVLPEGESMTEIAVPLSRWPAEDENIWESAVGPVNVSDDGGKTWRGVKVEDVKLMEYLSKLKCPFELYYTDRVE